MECYRAFAAKSYALGNGSHLVARSPEPGTALISALAADILRHCLRPRPLEAHLQELLALPQFRNRMGEVRSALSALTHERLLISDEALQAHLAVLTDPQEPVPPITELGIVTRSRPAALERCIRSFAANFREHLRQVEILVIDDSRDVTSCAANREAISRCSDQKLNIFYANRRDRQDYAASLAKRAGIRQEIVEFALLGDGAAAITTGAARNSLLLQSLGSMLVTVDDDVICRSATVPGLSPKLTIGTTLEPCRFWFFGDGQPLSQEPTSSDFDLLQQHEELLGRGIGECVAKRSSGELDLAPMTTQFLRKADGQRATVAVTMPGVLGESGMGNTLGLLTLPPAERKRLTLSPDFYESVLSRHEVLRSSPFHVISDAMFVFGLCMGLDNRRVLPPFMPVWRSEDLVFSACLARCCRGEYCGSLPFALLHDPLVRRNLPRSIRMASCGLSSGEFIFHVIMAQPPAFGKTDAALQRVGTLLAELGNSGDQEFNQSMQDYIRPAFARRMRKLKQVLDESHAEPEYWRTDVIEMLRKFELMAIQPDLFVPYDLGQVGTPEEARRRLKQLVKQYAEVFQAWPDLIACCREVKDKGIQLGGLLTRGGN